MISPHNSHFFDWDTLSLRQELVNEEAHYQHPTCEEDEQSELQMAQHRREDLCNCIGEYHVDGDIDTLSSWPDFEWEDFTGNQPA